MSRLEKLTAFAKRELQAFVAEAIRPRQEAPSAPDEGRLIQTASEGAVVRQFLESDQVLDFMARSEAQLITALLALPLDDDQGRRNLSVAIQSQRQMMRFLTEKARDGRAAEAELARLTNGPRAYF